MASSVPKVGYLRRAWAEFPEIVGSSVMGLIGVGFGAAVVYLYNTRDIENKKYKTMYTVYRPDDPRIPKIKKHCGLDD